MAKEYSDLFKESVPSMDTEPMVITLKPNYVSKAITLLRKIPYARRDREIKEIRKLEEEGILE